MKRALELLVIVAAIASSPALAREDIGDLARECIVEDVLAQVCYLRCSGNQSLAGTLSTTGDLKFVSGTGTGAHGYVAGENCINWGPSTGGNQWWLCGKPNSHLRVYNNNSEYSGYRLADGFFTVTAGVEGPQFKSTVASGSNGFACTVNNSKCVDFGAGANDYCGSDGTTITCPGSWAFGGNLSGTTATFSSAITSTATSGNSLQNNTSTYSLVLGTATNDATASASVAAYEVQPANAFSANDLIFRVRNSAGTGTFSVDQEGDVIEGGLVSSREFLVDKVSSGIGAGNLLATGTNYSGVKLAQAWTLTHLSINVTTASSATAANTVITATDATNTCTFTFACNTDTNTTGVKDKAGVNGAGTGCAYAAGALVTWSVTTQGCATAVTTNALSLWGKPQ